MKKKLTKLLSNNANLKAMEEDDFFEEDLTPLEIAFMEGWDEAG